MPIPERSQSYGRMFPPTKIKVDSSKERCLYALGSAMKDRPGPAKDAFSVSAGMTYFGQFIDHDITHDRTKLEESPVEPNTIHNHRTVRFDLEHIYGQGPKLSPQLYDRDGEEGRLLIGRTAKSTPPSKPGVELKGGTKRDFHRVDGKPQLADHCDPRNLENLFVMQIHVLFMKFHNVAMEQCFDKRFQHLPLPKTRFARAQQIVRWHYQWLVDHIFLRELIDSDVMADIRRRKDFSFQWYESGFFIPAEFSMAAFRFGHSMVRDKYVLNCHHDPLEVSLRDIIMRSHACEALPEHWLVEWGRLFNGIPKLRSSGGVTPSGAINTASVPELHNLPDETKRMFCPGSSTRQPSQLPVRTLLRGARAGLPTGQEVAQYLLEKKVLKDGDVLTNDELRSEVEATNDDSKNLLSGNWLEGNTPLYYYLLKEAEVKTDGTGLGPVGSRIVGEVIQGILREDPDSYLNKLGYNCALPSWKFPSGPRKLVSSIGEMVELVGDQLPQGCGPARFSGFKALGSQFISQKRRFQALLGLPRWW